MQGARDFICTGIIRLCRGVRHLIEISRENELYLGRGLLATKGNVHYTHIVAAPLN